MKWGPTSRIGNRPKSRRGKGEWARPAASTRRGTDAPATRYLASAPEARQPGRHMQKAETTSIKMWCRLVACMNNSAILLTKCPILAKHNILFLCHFFHVFSITGSSNFTLNQRFRKVNNLKPIFEPKSQQKCPVWYKSTVTKCTVLSEKAL